MKYGFQTLRKLIIDERSHKRDLKKDTIVGIISKHYYYVGKFKIWMGNSLLLYKKETEVREISIS